MARIAEFAWPSLEPVGLTRRRQVTWCDCCSSRGPTWLITSCGHGI
jgi:hypothetical protein